MVAGTDHHAVGRRRRWSTPHDERLVSRIYQVISDEEYTLSRRIKGLGYGNPIPLCVINGIICLLNFAFFRWPQVADKTAEVVLACSRLILLYLPLLYQVHDVKGSRRSLLPPICPWWLGATDCMSPTFNHGAAIGYSSGAARRSTRYWRACCATEEEAACRRMRMAMAWRG